MGCFAVRKCANAVYVSNIFVCRVINISVWRKITSTVVAVIPVIWDEGAAGTFST